MNRKMASVTENDYSFISYDESDSILVVFESDLQEKNKVVREQIKRLSADGKHVIGVGFVNKKETASPILDSWMILNSSDLNFWNQPRTEKISGLLEKEFDVLINLTTEVCIPVEYLSLMVNAKMKCALKRSDETCYNLLMDLPEPEVSEDEEQKSTEIEIQESEEIALFEQIYRYLKMINAKNN